MDAREFSKSRRNVAVSEQIAEEQKLSARDFSNALRENGYRVSESAIVDNQRNQQKKYDRYNARANLTYRAAVKKYENAAEEYNEHLQKMSYDVEAAQKEIEGYTKKHDDAVAALRDYERVLAENGITEQYWGQDAKYIELAKDANKDYSQEQAELRRKIKEASDYQTMVGYYGLMANDDFEINSGRTTEWNKYDKAVYGEDYNDPLERLNADQLREYGRIRQEYGAEAADNYMAQVLNYEGGEWYPNGIYLSDEEKKIFNYILNTQGDSAAEKYLRNMESTANYRAALADYASKNHTGISGLLNDYESYFSGGVESGIMGIANLFTNEEMPVSKSNQYSAIVRENRVNSAESKIGKWAEGAAADALSSGGNMLPSIVAGAFNPYLGKAFFGISAAGNAKQEALRDGYTASQATSYGILNGAAEVLLQDAVGGIAQIGGKGLSNALSKIPGAKSAAAKIENAISRISVGKQAAARTAINVLDNLSGEFSDEYMQEILNPVFRNICLGENNEFKPFTEEALYSGIIGALMAVGYTSTNAVFNYGNVLQISKDAFNAQNLRDTMSDFIENTSDIQREDVVKAREILSDKIENRESIDAGDIAAYTSTLTENEIVNGFGISESSVRDESDIRAQLGNAENANAVAGALYRMQNGELTESDAETVKYSPEGRALFSEYFDTDITESTSDGEISDAVRNVSDDSFREISYDAQNMLKSIRAHNGHTQEVDTAFYKAYFEGYNGVSRTWDSDSAISDAASQTAYELGADAKASIGTFKVVGGASISSDVSSAFSKIAKDMGVSITYGGKGSVANGGVRRGYFNSHGEIHIYEDAKVKQVGGKALYKGEAAARIILGHELTHVLQKRSPEQYKNFADLAVKASGGENEIAKYMRSYSLSRQNAIDEIAADFAMQYLFSDEKTARKITKHHSKLAQAILDAIAWIRDKLGIKTSDTETLMRMYGKMYNEGRRNASNSVTGDGVKNSIATYDSEGNVLSEQQEKFFLYSMITDDDGNLMPVYHATDAVFTVFDKSKLGANTEGNSDDEMFVATAYTGFWFSSKNLSGKAGSRSEKVYLNIKNPYYLPSIEALASKIYETADGETPREKGEDFATQLWLKGYDGIVIEKDEEFGGTSFVAFDSNQAKRVSNQNPTDDPDINNSIAGSEKILEEGVREANAVRGTYSSLAETLRAREDEARRAKREFLPDIETTNAVAAELGALGLADGATMTDLRKAVYDAAVAMRGAFLERRVMNADAKSKKNTAAAKKLLDAAKLIDMKKGEALTAKAEAIADALYQTNTSDRKTVKQLVEEYGSIKPGENPSRTVAVPKRTSPETNVSQTVRTVMEASVTPEDMLPTIEDAIENGDFSYETITDKSARLKARRKVAKDYQGALDDFHNGVRSGKLSKNQIAIGFELYNQAANAGTPESKKTAMDILVDIADSARTAGQSLQAVRMLKKMSPEWKLYAAERTARKMNEKLSKRQSRRATAVKESIENAMAVGREDAAKGMAKSVSKLGQGVPVEQWIDAIGELVSDGISSRMNPKTDKQRLVSRNVSGDLLKFAEDYLPKVSGSKKSKTAAERLADYFANKDNYEKAWDKAKQALREKYADNADALEALDRFLVGTLSYGDIANSSVAMSAIARAAIESDNSVKRLALRAKLGDAESVASEIFAKLNETVKAEGDDAIILRDAIRRYVLETAAESASPNALQNKIREAVREVGTTMSEIIRSGADERAETLRQITRYLTENIGISEDAAQQAAEIIDENFTAMTEEKSRDALEAFIKDKPKSVRKTAEERFTELANMGAFKGEYNEAIAKKLFGDTVKVNPNLAEKFLQAKTEAERDEILKDIYRDIGSQIPSTFLEKWTAWRYLSMLFNPTTHIRNMAGNAGNAPLVMTKNKIALALEQIFIKDKSNRTKAMLVGSGDLVRAAESDFESLKDVLFDGEKYKDNVNANKYIQEGRRIFKDRVKINGKGVLNTLYDFSGNALSAEDMLFKKRYYVNAMASFCKARGITADQMRKGVGLEDARAYAIREAQKATFNDANAFSNFVSGRSKYEIANLAKSAVLPFQRTPANILARGVEYSPIGLMKSLTYDAVKVYRGDMTGAEMIDNVSAGLTGTGLFALGAFLVSLGLVKFKGLDGGDDDKERKFEEMYGHQQYSIEVFGKSITLDWLAPESIPFFAGVNFMEAAGDGVEWNDVVQVLELFTDPMMNMSMLQGLNDAMENAKWSETDPLSSAVFGMLDSLISQNLPTLAGKLERITQSDRMTTYVDKNIWLPRGAQRSLGKLSQKLPGIDYNQIPYIDAWGAKETNDNAAWRAFDQLLNPAYTDTVTSTPLEQELIRLSRSTDETDVFPQRAKTYINVKVRTDGLPLTGYEKPEEVESVKVDLNKEQYVAYAQFKGKMSKRIATGLIGTPYYQSASDDLRRDMVKRVYELSDAAAKQTVSDYKANGWEAKALKTCAETGMTEVQYIVLYTQQSEISGQINGETVANYAGLQKMLLLYNASLTDKQREALKSDFGIGSKVSNLPKNAVENKIRAIEK